MFEETTEQKSHGMSESIDRRIARQIEMNAAYYAAHPREIDTRIEELDREWNVERALAAKAGAVSLVGLTLGCTAGRKWFLLPALCAGFLLQHAIQGRCAPMGLLRLMGVRTAEEIERERYALKALRGDFKDVPADPGQATLGSIGRLMEAIG